MVFNDLISFWKLVYGSYKEKEIKQIMYWYLTIVIGVIGALYVYLYYEGCVGLAIIFSHISGSGSAPVSIVQAVGIILMMRYTFMSGVDALAKSKPVNWEARLKSVEDKLADLHQLAFSEIQDDAPYKQPSEKEVTEIFDGIDKDMKEMNNESAKRKVKKL